MSSAISKPMLANELAEPSPYSATWQKIMIWFFIVTDGLTFAGFLACYGFARLASPAWPDQSQVFNLNLISLMTFVLISSSATMAGAVGAASDGSSRRATRFLLLTLLGDLYCFPCRHLSGRTLSPREEVSIRTRGAFLSSAVTFS